MGNRFFERVFNNFGTIWALGLTVNLTLIASAVAGVASGLYAYSTTPVLTSAISALVVGAGTFVGGIVAGVCGLAACVTLAFGVGAVIRSLNKGVTIKPTGFTKILTVATVALGGLASAGYGMNEGYERSKAAAVNKACAIPFNDAVAQQCKALGLSVAPKNTPPTGPKS